MTVTVHDIMSTETEIGDLAARVDALVAPPLPFGRVVNFDPAVAASFLSPDQTQKNPTWVNGGSDFWLCGLGYHVWMTQFVANFDGTFTLGASTKLHDNGTGLGSSSLGTGIRVGLFDFQWNMTKQENATGRQISYLGAPGGANSMLQRQALGNQETNRHLAFHPWKIAHGDSVFFPIKPIGYSFGPFDYAWGTAPLLFTTVITLFGFRVEAT